MWIKARPVRAHRRITNETTRSPAAPAISTKTGPRNGSGEPGPPGPDATSAGLGLCSTVATTYLRRSTPLDVYVAWSPAQRATWEGRVCHGRTFHPP